SADFEGFYDEKHENPCRMTFVTKDKFRVYTSDAVHMNLVLPKYSYYNHDYVIKVNLTNNSENTTIYDLDFTVDRKMQTSKTALIVNERSADEITETTTTKYKTLSLTEGPDGNKKIHIDELKPGAENTVTIEITVKDLWKSVFEQYIAAELFDQKQAFLINMLRVYNDISDIKVISEEYTKLFSEIPTEHILKNVRVGFEGSQAPVSYSVTIDKETNAPAERTAVVNTKYARNRLKDIFNGSTDPKTDFEEFRNEFIFNIDNKDEEQTERALAEYVNKKFENGTDRAWDSIIADDDVFFTLHGGKKSKIYFEIESRDDDSDIPVIVSNDVVEITDIYGNTAGEDGKLVINEDDDIVRVKFIRDYVNGVVIIEYEDGTKEVQKIKSAEPHECQSTGRFNVVKTPGGGEPGLAISVCDVCGEFTDCCSINPDAVAMLGNSNTYADIRVAVEEAVKAGESTELTIFGDIVVTDDVIIPEYVDVIIADNANITVKDGCKLIAKGKVTDLSGRKYDLSGNGPVVPETTATTSAAASTTTTTTTTTTTSTTTSTDTSTTTTTTTTTATDASTTTTTTTEASETTEPVTTTVIGTPEQFAQWAAVDYQNKNDKLVGDTEVNTSDNGMYEIILKDASGNVLDVYTIDPQTGKGTNSANEAVDLSQVESSTMTNLIIALASFMMLVFGSAAGMISKVLEALIMIG
ncbi:MAG: hypothetical protein J6U00_02720, partial [Ruminococcus sp.]|uniref:hypothetical protein n=1 Tax=Ruminococcus sp. TaxID=41978 RepID=UPI001B092144